MSTTTTITCNLQSVHDMVSSQREDFTPETLARDLSGAKVLENRIDNCQGVQCELNKSDGS